MTTENFLRKAIWIALDAQAAIEQTITRTPIGLKQEILREANTHAIETVNKLKEAARND